MILFVYGTLKRGHRLNGFLSNAAYLGEAFTTGKLYNLGSYPGMVWGDGIVYGEVYEVDDFATLDRVEGTPTLYKRELQKFHWADNPHDYNFAHMYHYQGAVREEDYIHSGVWK